MTTHIVATVTRIDAAPAYSQLAASPGIPDPAATAVAIVAAIAPRFTQVTNL